MINVIRHPRAFLFNGDSGALALKPNTIDAIVCDPPAGIDFMGKGWDSDKGGRDVWIKWLAATLGPAFAALKPGGHALVWALPRTSHWTATALEDLGFEIRDVVMHLFGTGFPKSLDVSKAIDSRLGAERQVVGEREVTREIKYDGKGGNALVGGTGGGATMIPVTAPATPEAEAWEGWGTALKPAAEHWILCRKPLEGTVAQNVLTHGTGALNIGGCRIDGAPRPMRVNAGGVDPRGEFFGGNGKYGSSALGEQAQTLGRWPAHVTMDEEAAAILDEQSGFSKSPKKTVRGGKRDLAFGMKRQENVACHGDSGGASRFFYVAKAPRKEKDLGCEALPVKTGGEATDRVEGSAGLGNPRAGAGRTGGARNHHPTVKSIALMRWLCRLITPPGGVVLDPFTGSGSTAVAALAEGFKFVGCEMDPEYVKIAKARIEYALAQKESP
jgi:site-specific DNA-methyltransferase (adenine-specific)